MNRVSDAVSGSGGREAAWWSGRRMLAAAVAAVVFAILAFLFRFNTLGGVLGGFDDDHFAHLMRSVMLLHGEQPLRDFADAELRGAWPSLSYAVPAWAQQIGGRTLLSEGYLTAGALALAHAIVFLLALDLSQRWSVASVAAATAVITGPKLYNYPKVLVLALAALAIRIAMNNPTVARLGVAAAVTAIATLFRHDYGVYAAVGIVAGLIARDPRLWTVTLRRIATYGALTTLFLLPSAIWIQRYEGIWTYMRRAFDSSQLETARTELRLQQLDLSAPFAGDSLLALTYYAFWAGLIVAACLLAVRGLAAGAPVSATERATAVGLLGLALIVNQFFLRANLSQRFGDAVIPVVLLAAWCVGTAPAIRSLALRRVALTVPAALLVFILSASYVFADAALELDTSGLSDSIGKVERRFTTTREDLAKLPPYAWAGVSAEGTLPAARYVAQCTAPDDYLLVAGYAPEIPVFARRRFAAGQATVSLSFYTSEADQQRALARLERQSVPIVLAESDDFEEGFLSDYPLLARYVQQHYQRAGMIDVDGDPRFLVFVRADREPRGKDPYLGLPCFS